MIKKIAVLALVLLLAVSCNNNSSQVGQSQPTPTPAAPTPTAASTPAESVTQSQSSQSGPSQLGEPISDAKSRVTKKPFGIYVSPGNSPVSPERFTGYHTGVDFETTPAEQDTDVPVYSICDGKVLVREYASGYGGVLVQLCTLNGSPITVVYGHLRLSSITASVGKSLKKGDKIAVLGKGYSSETDGERKHLHLGIHKGSSVNIKGYVQTKPELSAWINFADYLQ